MLKFDDATLKLIDVSYRGADITRRRMANMAALAPGPGDRVLDLGCGQGMMTEELARAVGPTGEVIGVDPSPEMRRAAEARCADHANIRLLDGTATAIPLAADAVDGAVTLQVLEYVAEIAGALAEFHRVLRPGGRVVIGDMQWGTLSWASDDPDRMARMTRAWERHVAEPNLPARLPAALAAAGFQLIELRPLPFVATELRPDGLPHMMMHLMRGYAVQNDHLTQAEADAWFAEQEARAAAGRFFCALTHFIAIAIRR